MLIVPWVFNFVHNCLNLFLLIHTLASIKFWAFIAISSFHPTCLWLDLFNTSPASLKLWLINNQVNCLIIPSDINNNFEYCMVTIKKSSCQDKNKYINIIR